MNAAALSIGEAGRLLRAGKLSVVELTQACLARIAERNGDLNAFLTVTDELALRQAREADDEIARGHWRGPLHGIPIGLKDLFDTAGIRTTAGSALYADRVPKADCSAYARLREAGAILLGKQNMNEFAFGATGLNPHFGRARSPVAVDRLTGGSSSGSAAAVGSGMGFAALGSDTGGSIRCPAALCGLVGLKPTYGRVSRAGVVPLAWSLDHVGPLARSVDDARLVYETIAGPDPADATTLAAPPRCEESPGGRSLKGMRIGRLSGSIWRAEQPQVRAATDACLLLLQSLGARIIDVELPDAELAAAAQNVIITAEAAAFHAAHLRVNPERIGETVRRRLLPGLLIDAVDLLQARRVRSRVARRVQGLLERVDVLAMPAVPILAPREGDQVVRAGSWEVPPQAFMVRNTFLFNLTGHPAISVPRASPEGLPVGVQFAARAWEEPLLFTVARAVEAG